MKKSKKTITNELDLLIKRQTKGEAKTVENELSLVEKLESELKERKREAKLKMKEEEDKKIIEIARSIMKENDFKTPEELSKLPVGKDTKPALTAEQEEALKPLLQAGLEVIDQPNKYLDLNILKNQLTHLYQVFSGK